MHLKHMRRLIDVGAERDFQAVSAPFSTLHMSTVAPERGWGLWGPPSVWVEQGHNRADTGPRRETTQLRL